VSASRQLRAAMKASVISAWKKGKGGWAQVEAAGGGGGGRESKSVGGERGCHVGGEWW
jgi:hypothetical protein